MGLRSRIRIGIASLALAAAQDSFAKDVYRMHQQYAEHTAVGQVQASESRVRYDKDWDLVILRYTRGDEQEVAVLGKVKANAEQPSENSWYKLRLIEPGEQKRIDAFLQEQKYSKTSYLTEKQSRTFPGFRH
jgi:hypothetical protein